MILVSCRKKKRWRNTYGKMQGDQTRSDKNLMQNKGIGNFCGRKTDVLISYPEKLILYIGIIIPVFHIEHIISLKCCPWLQSYPKQLFPSYLLSYRYCIC